MIRIKKRLRHPSIHQRLQIRVVVSNLLCLWIEKLRENAVIRCWVFFYVQYIHADEKSHFKLLISIRVSG